MAYRKGHKRGSNNPYSRQRRIEEHLRGRRFPVSLADLAEFVGKSTRTIRRDLEALEEAGNLIERSINDLGDSEGERTMVRMVSRKFVDVQLTRGEAHALAATLRMWSPFAGTCLAEDIERIHAKIAESLPPPERAALQGDAQRFYFVPEAGLRDYRGKREQVDEFQRAVVDTRRVFYRYRAATGQWFSGLLEPHALVAYRNTLYVLGRRVPSARAMRLGEPTVIEWVRWPVDRFVAVKMLTEAFEVAPDFDIAAHFDGFGIIRDGDAAQVVVDFAPKIATFVRERVWHHTQAIATLPSGWVRLTFRTSNLKEVQNWIQSFGAAAVVRSPANLRDAVLAQFNEALAVAAAHPALTPEELARESANAAHAPATTTHLPPVPASVLTETILEPPGVVAFDDETGFLPIPPPPSRR
jgi:predicted DNA-binding transcriptional regulator YafY